MFFQLLTFELLKLIIIDQLLIETAEKWYSCVFWATLLKTEDGFAFFQNHKIRVFVDIAPYRARLAALMCGHGPVIRAISEVLRPSVNVLTCSSKGFRS